MTNRTSNRRGLAALIPTDGTNRPRDDRPRVIDSGPPETTAPLVTSSNAPAQVAGLELVSVRPLQVVPNPKQPRTEFDPDALTELAQSLGDVGFLQPIVVRRIGSATDVDQRFELVAGERRWRASQLAELETIPAIVRSTDDDALLRDALLENLQRVALNPLEEAAAYDQLLADFGGTHEELARKLGRSRPQVSNTLRLLKLPTAVQRRVAAGVLSAGHARALLSLEDEQTMDVLAKRVIAEGISVRALEELVTIDQPQKKPGRKKSTGRTPVELQAVADRIGDALETRVQISATKSKGRISIEFADVEDLHRIVGLIDPSVIEK
ncbi:MAG TPA: chromosome partitioning protein ParB [Actinobacteria bacterium]|nr:chromosome partitioning protein ParB [Actinomycetota bacterium]